MSLIVQSHTSDEVKKINTELTYAMVSADVAVFRKTTTTESDKAGQEVQVMEGFSLKNGIDGFLAGDSEALTMAHCAVLSLETQDILRTRGFVAGLEHMSTERRGAHETTPLAFLDTPYALLVEEGVDVGLVANMDYGSHVATFLTDGNPVPIAIHCGYIDGWFKDGCYDINKAVEILKANPNVRPSKKGADLARDVPYYNVSPGCSRYLEFVYMPTREDAKRLWERQMSYGMERPEGGRYRAMFDEDILGLRAGGAAYCDTFGVMR